MNNLLKCKTVIIKVASRCNLNCTYCYMYNMGDGTYRNQPKTMSYEIVNDLLNRIQEHCHAHDLHEFMFIFHGGEPLLVKKEFYQYFITKAKQKFKNEGVHLRFVIQTNGVLIDESWCNLFNELNISVGISIDGTKDDNDIYRIDHSGKGAYDKILKGLKIAQKNVANGIGTLSVVNIDADPIKTYEHLKSLDVTSIDFLLPDSNYHSLPPLPKNKCKGEKYEEYYADWLIKVFDQWFHDKKNRPLIRMFRYILHMLFGGRASLDSLGLENNEALVIETDGSIEALDVLKICGDGFTKDNAHVKTHSFDQALSSDLAKLYNLAHNNLCDQCLACELVSVCGGGNLPHRYSSESGFNNPSVYCKTLAKLIIHIQNELFNSLPPDLINSSGIQKMDYDVFLKTFQKTRNTIKLELENF
ncbi:radical SAM protein [Polaribacter cellanae]|uniref:Radical SAM protein n=1 Tax=Polaribacter cellanae TaxID=2818493 RepID=A0A975H6H0_9FLAO|nr:radical SAM protein [Polaribacter cellanae]QTE21988.1 radical SAM protein [Polaribacter cellanae]